MTSGKQASSGQTTGLAEISVVYKLINNLVQQLSGTQHFFLQQKLNSHLGNKTLQLNLNIEIKV